MHPLMVMFMLLILGVGALFVAGGGLNKVAGAGNPFGNVTDILPKENRTEGITDILTRFPIQAGLDSMFAGGVELLRWFSDLLTAGLNGLLGYVNAWLKTDIHVPAYFTALIMFIVAGLYFYGQAMQMMSGGWNALTVFLALLAMLAAIIFLLVTLGYLK